MKTLIALLLVAFFSVSGLYAQDTIVKRDSVKINCSIKEILSDEIKYLTPGVDIVIGINKDDVSRVILSSGLVIKFQKAIEDKDNYKGQNKNALKFRLLSPLYGYSDFVYEHSLKPGASIECAVGIVGLGNKYGDDLGGISLRLGYKFIKSPDYYLKGMQYAHILKGAYFEPQLAASFYKRNADQITSAAILFNVGNQWVFNDMILIDLYFGLGYGYSSDNSINYQYGYVTGASEFPIAITSGFRIGVLF
jgi:hypothetical protein